MRRLIIAFIITIVLGVGIYFLTTLFTGQEEDIPTNKEKAEEKEEYAVSNWQKITIEDLKEKLEAKEEIVLFIGKTEDENTKKVSTNLGNIDNIDSLNVYYLEKTEEMNEDTLYQNFLTTYPDLSNYMNFTPVILVFRENVLIGGLPGGVEEKNLINFLKYTEVFA